jgi:hypothetical protein
MASIDSDMSSEILQETTRLLRNRPSRKVQSQSVPEFEKTIESEKNFGIGEMHWNMNVSLPQTASELHNQRNRLILDQIAAGTV